MAKTSFELKIPPENDWRMREYAFFSHVNCEAFPCHKDVDPGSFNCLFCYCPLYPLGDKCGGIFKYRDGIKDCTDCGIPHIRDNYGLITKKLSDFYKGDL